MPSSWCKVSSDLDSHPKIRRAGRNGREVFTFALRRNSGQGIQVPGLLPASYMEPWYLADQLMMSEAEAADGLQRAIAAGLLEHVGEGYCIVGWDDEWGKSPKSAAERMAEYRARKRGDLPVSEKKTYAIEQVGSNFIKIGRAANISQRLNDLQVASPLPLRLVAFTLSDIEGQLHSRLAAHQASGEWFHLNGEVLEVLASYMELATEAPDGGLLVTRVTSPRVTRDARGDALSLDQKRKEKTEDTHTHARERHPAAGGIARRVWEHGAKLRLDLHESNLQVPAWPVVHGTDNAGWKALLDRVGERLVDSAPDEAERVCLNRVEVAAAKARLDGDGNWFASASMFTRNSFDSFADLDPKQFVRKTAKKREHGAAIGAALPRTDHPDNPTLISIADL